MVRDERNVGMKTGADRLSMDNGEKMCRDVITTVVLMWVCSGANWSPIIAILVSHSYRLIDP